MNAEFKEVCGCQISRATTDEKVFFKNYLIFKEDIIV